MAHISLPSEHTPTYTTGRRDLALTSSSNHPEQAKMLHSGATFHQTKRGGQVTYHGMGQLVGYPILDIGSGGMSVSQIRHRIMPECVVHFITAFRTMLCRLHSIGSRHIRSCDAQSLCRRSCATSERSRRSIRRRTRKGVCLTSDRSRCRLTRRHSWPPSAFRSAIASHHTALRLTSLESLFRGLTSSQLVA